MNTEDEYKPPVVSGSPAEIWLCYGDLDEDDTHRAAVDYGCVSWCSDKVDESDVRYVRADIYQEAEKEIVELKRKITELKNQ